MEDVEVFARARAVPASRQDMKKLAIIAALALAAAGCATSQPVPVLVDGKPTGETYTPPACTGTAERILMGVLDVLGGTGTTTPTGPPCK
jgi:hypothetical protein